MNTFVEIMKVFGSLVVSGSILYGAKKLGDLIDELTEDPKEEAEKFKDVMTNYYDGRIYDDEDL